MRTITIVGGGIAGLSLGIALSRREIPVTIYEKRSYPQHRVCGEFISGVSDEVLEELGILEIVESGCRVPKVEWFVGERRVMEQAFESEAYGVSRYALDAALAEEFVRIGGRLEIGSSQKSETSEGIVWATGKPKNKGGEWIGLSVHLSNCPLEHLEMHSGENGYIGLSPIEEGRTNVTGLFKRNSSCKGKGLELIVSYLESVGLHGLADRLSGFQVVGGSFCAVSGFSFGEVENASEVSIGDAARLIPPFVGNGMSMAIEAAAMVAETMEDYARGRIEWGECSEMVVSQTAKLFHTRMKVAMWFHPLLLSKFGLRAISMSSRARVLPVKTLYKLTR